MSLLISFLQQQHHDISFPQPVRPDRPEEGDGYGPQLEIATCPEAVVFSRKVIWNESGFNLDASFWNPNPAFEL